MTPELLIYVHKLTPRVRYTFRLFFGDILKLNVQFAQSKEDFINHKYPKISYAYQPISDELSFVPHGLLFDKGIEQFEVNPLKNGSNIGFFKVTESPFPFDVFAATFFLVTRYEEYLPHVKDKHGRFSAKHSLVYRAGFLETPLINLWAQEMELILKQRFSTLKIPEKKFTVTPTIDVDSAYAFKEKGLVRTVAGVGKDIVKADFKGLKKRVNTIVGLEKDPFDVFDALIDLQKKIEYRFIFFFLVGDYDKNDKSVPISSRKFQALIKHVNDYAEVGIHPSFASNNNTDKLGKEVQRISSVLHYPVNNSRQHFLKLHLPDTYRNLIEFEITDDFSMGYPDHSGFRASICTPFYFYDLELDVETNLKVHPFCFMEATYKYYYPSSPDETLKKALDMAKEVKKVHGNFGFVWHSDSISGMEPWMGWENLLYEVLEGIKQL